MIKVSNLCKRFGDFTAVDELSFQVQAGEVLGFLGPNGAGKSTTMKMISGFLTPTSGSVSVCGFDVASETQRAQACIGYLPEGAPSYGDMTVQQFLTFVAEIRGFKGKARGERVAAVVQRLSLQGVIHKTIDTLSKGFRRRVGLAQAILHDPTVLILDEPTDGLDPNQKQQVRNLIANLSRDKIVIVSTHILEEVAAVCTRALIIADGKLRFDGTPEQLVCSSRYHNAVNIHLQDVWSAAEGLRGVPGVAALDVLEEGRRLIAYAEGGRFIYPQVDDYLRQFQAPIDSISVESGRLDEVFQRITQEAA